MNVLFTCFAILFSALSSCSKPAQSSVQFEDTPAIKLKDCFQKTAGSQTINLCFDSVLEDSRCPKNVQCIWLGVARIQLTFSSKNFAHSFTLASLKVPPHYSNDTTVEGYKIQFIHLYPYPGDALSEEKAEVKIAKQ